MDRKILTVFALLTGSALISCEKDAEIPLPQDEPKLVVHSYFSPGDTAINVSVSSSDPIFDDGNENTFAPLENSTVTITTNSNTYTLSFNQQSGLYTIPTTVLPVNPAQQYAIGVSHAGYETVTASTTVPQSNNFNFQISLISVTPPNPDAGLPSYHRYQISWNHFNTTDYYRVAASFYYADTAFTGEDTAIENLTNYFYSPVDVSGSGISDQIEAYTVIYEDPYPFENGFYFDLIISNKQYHDFHEALNRFTQGDPFSEPSMVPTNITNGFGMFAGYLRISKRLD